MSTQDSIGNEIPTPKKCTCCEGLGVYCHTCGKTEPLCSCATKAQIERCPYCNGTKVEPELLPAPKPVPPRDDGNGGDTVSNTAPMRVLSLEERLTMDSPYPPEEGYDTPEPVAPGDAGEFIDIVFDGPPGPECGRFVEVEDPQQASIGVGEWIHREDGYWALRIPDPRALTRAVAERDALAQKLKDAVAAYTDEKTTRGKLMQQKHALRAQVTELEVQLQHACDDCGSDSPEYDALCPIHALRARVAELEGEADA